MEESKKYDELKEKYSSLIDKAEMLSNVGHKLLGLIEQNAESIKWYQGIAAKAAEEGQDDAYWLENIGKLEKENALLLEIEKDFWKKHVF